MHESPPTRLLAEVVSGDVKEGADARATRHQAQCKSEDLIHVIGSLTDMPAEERGEILKRLEQRCMGSDCLQTSKILISTMASLNYQPGRSFMMRVEEVCTTTAFEGLQSRDLLVFLQSFIKMDHQPGPPFLQALEDRCQKVDVVQSHASALSEIILYMVRLGCQLGPAILHPFQCACEVLGFNGFTVHDLAKSLASMVKVDHNKLESTFLDAFAKACLKHGFAAFPLSGLCSIVSTLGRLNGATGTDFWDQLQEWCISNDFRGMDPRYLTMLVHAIGQVKRKANPAFLVSFVCKCQSLGLDRFDARSLSIIICSLALKGLQAGTTKDSFLRDFVPACESLGLDTFDPHHLSIISQSLIKLGHPPNPSNGWPSYDETSPSHHAPSLSSSTERKRGESIKTTTTDIPSQTAKRHKKK